MVGKDLHVVAQDIAPVNANRYPIPGPRLSDTFSPLRQAMPPQTVGDWQF